MTSNERWWWLSFCDSSRPTGQHSLGVAIVRARDLIEAVKVAHATGCNPGGEVMGQPMPPSIGDPPAEWDHKLARTRAEIKRLESMWTSKPPSITTLDDLEDESRSS